MDIVWMVANGPSVDGVRHGCNSMRLLYRSRYAYASLAMSSRRANTTSHHYFSRTRSCRWSTVTLGLKAVRVRACVCRAHAVTTLKHPLRPQHRTDAFVFGIARAENNARGARPRPTSTHARTHTHAHTDRPTTPHRAITWAPKACR